jgi:hypothetical protein
MQMVKVYGIPDRSLHGTTEAALASALHNRGSAPQQVVSHSD